MCFLNFHNFQLSYCKSRVLKDPEVPVNNVSESANHVSASSSSGESSRPQAAIFIVPTTSQVMEMFITQANAAAPNNLTDPTRNYRCKPPPSYGTVVIDVPPSYEQAVERLDNGVK